MLAFETDISFFEKLFHIATKNLLVLDIRILLIYNLTLTLSKRYFRFANYSLKLFQTQNRKNTAFYINRSIFCLLVL